MRNLMLVLFGGACLCGWGEIPKQVDLLVIGGSVDAVQAAIDAKRNGENVFLVTAYPYLGEDMAATLELGFGQMCPSDPLLFSMWKASSDIAPFDYWPDHRSQGKRWVYHNDPYDRNIRIAPSFPTVEQLEKSMICFCLCERIAALETLL